MHTSLQMNVLNMFEEFPKCLTYVTVSSFSVLPISIQSHFLPLFGYYKGDYNILEIRIGFPFMKVGVPQQGGGHFLWYLRVLCGRELCT